MAITIKNAGGPVVGPVLVVLMQEGLRDFKEFRLSLFGAIVVAVVLFLPRGIMGFVARRPDRALPVSKASHAPRAQYS